MSGSPSTFESRNAKEWTLFSSRTMAGLVSGARRHRFQTKCPGLATRMCHCDFEPYTFLRPRFLHISFKRGPMKNSTVYAFVCAITAGGLTKKRKKKRPQFRKLSFSFCLTALILACERTPGSSGISSPCFLCRKMLQIRLQMSFVRKKQCGVLKM